MKICNPLKELIICCFFNDKLNHNISRFQIVFVNKSEHGATEVYSLYDFKDFRENMDAEKASIQGRFDAVPYVGISVSSIKALLEDKR